jgi:hypothetical protein
MINLCFIEGKKQGKEEKKKDDNTVKPTRPIGAYFFFSNEFVPKIKKDEGISHRDAMSKCGAAWNQMSEKEKAPYEELHKKD